MRRIRQNVGVRPRPALSLSKRPRPVGREGPAPSNLKIRSDGPSAGERSRRNVDSASFRDEAFATLSRPRSVGPLAGLPLATAGSFWGSIAGARPTRGVPFEDVPRCVTEPNARLSPIDVALAAHPATHDSGRVSLSKEVLAAAAKEFYEPGLERLESWTELVSDPAHRALPERLKVDLANRWVNAELAYLSDSKDDWKSAVDAIASGTGDCEDFAIAKYATLRLLGVPPERLSIALGVTKTSGELHAVVFWTEGHTTRVLDNRVKTIETLSKADLMPALFDFNELGATGHPAPGVSKDAHLLLESDSKVRSTLERLRPLLTP
ncbi:MAG: transglutaminase-like cysteine peptidase [Deltaproteobacteria bacterium]|nr:transglutaminase-like cysteine peptidase [Deltaproteobacteria bacterium]